MAANPNTFAFKQVWDNLYEITHYKQPVYRAIASEKIEQDIAPGDTFWREYTSDFFVENLGADGSYNTQGLTDTQESLVINTQKDVAFYVAKPDLVKQHLPTVVKYARKAHNRLFLQIDGDVLSAAASAAGSVIDDGSLGGVSGNGLTPTVANIPQIFVYAQQALQLQNVEYGPNEKFSGDVKLDTVKSMAVSIISPQVYAVLLLYLGGKTTLLGDQTTKNGFAGLFMGFNIFVSNNIGFTSTFALSVNAIDGDTITINGVTFTWKNATATAGQITIGGTVAASNTNLAAALNAPFTTSATFTALSGTSAQKKALMNLAATAGATSTVITMTGWGSVPVSATMTSNANVWTAALQKQHCVFGVNNSISLVIAQRPEFLENPVTGKVGRDFVTWTLYGYKVFTDQVPMLVDVQVNASAFTQPSNLFN